MAGANLGYAVMRTRLDLNGLQTGFNSARSEAERAAQNLTRIGTRMSLAVTAPITAMGAAVLGVAGEFEQSMNKVAALTGSVGTEFDALREQAKQLGATTAFSASQAANAMGFLAMAGFDTNQIMGSMADTLNLAAAAQLDLGQAADIVSNILTGFNLDTSELGGAVDVLTKAFTSANTDLAMLADGMKYVGPIASGLGVSFEETSATLGLLSNAGIQAGMSGTSLRNILGTLVNESDKLGIQTLDTSGKLRPLADIIDDLAAKGFNTADALAMFGDRAGPAMGVLLTQGGDALREFTAALEDSGGTAEAIAAKQMEGFRGKVVELKSAVEGLLISIGDAGVIDVATRAAEALTGLVRTLDSVPGPIKTVGVAVAGLAAATGPLLLTMGGVIRALPLLTTGFVALRTALAFLTGPVGLIALAAGGLITLGVRMVNARDNARDLSGRIDELNEIMSVTGDEGRDLSKVFEELEEASDEDGLRGAINALAATLEGDGKAAFVAFAEQAIATGGDVDEVAKSIMANFAAIRQEMLETRLDSALSLEQLAQAELSLAAEKLGRARQQGGICQEYVDETAELRRQLEAELAVPEQYRSEINERQIASLQERIRLREETINNASTYYRDAEAQYNVALQTWRNAGDAALELRKEVERLEAFARGEVDSPFGIISPTVEPGVGASTPVPVPGGGVPSAERAEAELTLDSIAGVEAAIKDLREAWRLAGSDEARWGIREELEELEAVLDRMKHGVPLSVVPSVEVVGHPSDLFTPERIAEMAAAEVLGPTEGMKTLNRERLEYELNRIRDLQAAADAQAEAELQAAWDAYVAAMHDPARLARMDADEVLGPSAGMKTLPPKRLEYELNRIRDQQWEHYINTLSSPARLAEMEAAEVLGPSAGMLTTGSPGNLSARLGTTGESNRKRALITEVFDDAEQRLIDLEARAEILGEPFGDLERSAAQVRVMRDALLELLAEGISPSDEALAEYVSQLDAFVNAHEEAAVAVEEQAEREQRFALAMQWAQEELGELPGKLELNIATLIEYRDGLDMSKDGAEALSQEINSLIEGLTTLKDKQDAATNSTAKFAAGMHAATQHTTGLASAFTRAAANVAEGLNKIQLGGDDKLSGVAQLISGITTAVNGLNTAIDDGFDANSVFDLVTGIGTIGAEVIGTLTGIPGLGEVAGAAFGLLSSVIGDLSDGMAEVNAQLDEMEGRFNYLSRETLDLFAEKFTRQVSAGGIAGSFGATKAELDLTLMNATTDLAESFASTIANAFIASDFETAFEDNVTKLIQQKLIEAFMLTPEMQAYIRSMVEFLNKILEDGEVDEDELKELKERIEDGKRLGREQGKKLDETGLFDDPAASRIRTGGSRITDLTGPARDHFSDLLAPLNVLPQGISILTQIRDLLASAAGVPTASTMAVPAAASGFIVHGDIVVQSTATDIEALSRDIARNVKRALRGA